MRISCYLRKSIVYVPTFAKTQAGFYQEIEPVRVASIADIEAIRRAFREAIARGNPTIPTPPRSSADDAVLLKYAKVKAWSVFARNATVWAIDDGSGKYEILGYRKGAPRGWVVDPDQTETFPPGTAVDTVIDRMIAILQAAAG